MKQCGKTIRRALTALLLAAMLPALSVQALAEGAGAEEMPAFVDEEELTAVIKNAVDELTDPNYFDNGLPISVAIRFTRSDEIYYLNADEWYFAASLYKLPMIMHLTRLAEEGQLEDKPVSIRDETEMIKEQCLVHSNNTWSLFTWRSLFSDDSEMARVALDFAHFPEEELPPNFFKAQVYSTYYSARFMLGIIEELYNNPDQYPGVIDYMCLAQPEEYFRAELLDTYPVAQKYGSAEGCNHTAGIIYTPSPILLVIMTDGLGASFGNHLIGHVAAAIADYALLVDERADAWEAAQLAAAATPAPTPQPTAAPTPEPTAGPEATPEPAAPTGAPVPEPEAAQPAAGNPLWFLLLIPVAAGTLYLFRKKKKTEE